MYINAGPSLPTEEAARKKLAGGYARIGNKLYNTETAFFIGEVQQNGIIYTLYRKRSGEFFFYLADIAHTPSARMGTIRTNESRIKPVSYSEAEEWAKEFLDEFTYIKTFQGSENKNRTFNVSISDKAYSVLKNKASAKSTSMSDIIEQTIKPFLEIEFLKFMSNPNYVRGKISKYTSKDIQRRIYENYGVSLNNQEIKLTDIRYKMIERKTGGSFLGGYSGSFVQPYLKNESELYRAFEVDDENNLEFKVRMVFNNTYEIIDTTDFSSND